MDLDEYPSELLRYVELNREYDRNEQAGMGQSHPVMAALMQRMEEAWFDAPLWVRVKVDAREFRDVIREAWIQRRKNR